MAQLSARKIAVSSFFSKDEEWNVRKILSPNMKIKKSRLIFSIVAKVTEAQKSSPVTVPNACCLKCRQLLNSLYSHKQMSSTQFPYDEFIWWLQVGRIFLNSYAIKERFRTNIFFNILLAVITKLCLLAAAKQALASQWCGSSLPLSQ